MSEREPDKPDRAFRSFSSYGHRVLSSHGSRRHVSVSFRRKKRCIGDLSGTTWHALLRFVPVCRGCRRTLPSPHSGQRLVLQRFLAGRFERPGECLAHAQLQPRQIARQQTRLSAVISCWFLYRGSVFHSRDSSFTRPGSKSTRIERVAHESQYRW